MLILIVLATLVFVVFYLIVLTKAFKDTVYQGALCFFLWPYAFYYAFARLESERKNLIATVMLVTFLAGPGAAYLASRYQQPDVDDPCRFLAKADAEEVLGETVGEPQRKLIDADWGQMKACAYDAVARKRGVGVAFMPTCASLERARGIAREADPANLLDISGVGGEAFWTAGVLYVRSHEQCFMASVSDAAGGLTRQDRLEASKTLALKVIRQITASR